MVGVDRAIFDAAPDLDRHDVINALTDYVNSPDYQQAMVEGATRVALDGSSAGTVTASHAQWAQTKLKQRP